MCFSSITGELKSTTYICYPTYILALREYFMGFPGVIVASLRKLSRSICHSHHYILVCFTTLPQFSPSILTSEGMPVYLCVQNPQEFVLILPGAYHAEFDSGFNCYEAVNFAPFDWLPHGQNAVELYREQDRKTSISHDKLLLEAAAEAIRALKELALRNENSFDNSKWREVCRNYGYLTKALKTRVATAVRIRKYLCASLELRKVENDVCGTTKRECVTCLYDLIPFCHWLQMFAT